MNVITVSYLLLMNKIPVQRCLVSNVVKTQLNVTTDVHNFLIETNTTTFAGPQVYQPPFVAKLVNL